MSVRYHSLGPFEVLSRIGSGGMADVFKAWDSRDGSLVALKIPRSDPTVREAELAGARLQQQLSAVDPRVPKVFEIHAGDDEVYIAMEYVPGEDLADRIARGPLEPREAVRIAIELCELMSAAQHCTATAGADGRGRQGIVHGDLKPRNVRIRPDGAVRVLDFGIAKALSLTRALTRNEFGSLPYSSPERIDSGLVDVHSDLWAVSVVLYEMVTGRQPFRGESTRRLEDFIRSRARLDDLPDALPGPLAAVLHKALAPMLERRYAGPEALRDDLLAFLDGRPTQAAAEGMPVASYEATRRTTHSANGGPEATRRTLGTDAPAAGDLDATRATLGNGAAAAAMAAGAGAATPAGASAATTPASAPTPAAAAAPVPPPATASAPAVPAPAPPRGLALPARLRRLPWRRLLLFAAVMLLFNEFRIMNAADELRSALPNLPRGESEAVWTRFQQLNARSLLGFGTMSLDGDVKDWFVNASDELIADYRSDTPVIRETGWRTAATLLGHAASIAPGDRGVRGRLAYCRGHLSRINAVAAKERGQAADARRHFNEATRLFEDAARLRPDWPDPHLGLARTYVYGLEDPERARDALSRAEQDGYSIGNRDMALLGDGYRLRAERTWAHAADYRDQPHEDRYLDSIKDDCDQALNHYSTVPAYGEVSRSIRKVQDLLDKVDAREGQMRGAGLRRVGLGFLTPLLGKGN
jgi:hypothetical protein